MSKSRDKGTRFESEVVDYLKERGFPHAERRALGGHRDRGDIAGVPGWMLECKAEQRIDWAGYADEVRRQQEHAGTPNGAAVIKRRGHPVERAYVQLDLATFVRLVDESTDPITTALRAGP